MNTNVHGRKSGGVRYVIGKRWNREEESYVRVRFVHYIF